VAEHDVGSEAGLAQVERYARDLLCVENRGLGLAQVVVNLRRYRAAWLIDDLANARQLSVLTLGYEDRLMAGLTPEVPRQVQILSGEVLVCEENFHRIPH
jgi:ferric-dicitrate binding protein FerR (iron transport regulator)